VPSPSSSSAQQARQALADQLREIRLEAGMTGAALAAAAGWHGGSKVSKIERGKRPPSIEDVRAWCRVCGVSAERAEELLDEQRAVAGMWTDYRRLNRRGLAHAQAWVRPIYERSSRVRSYQPKIIPGLLQTSEYTTAVLSAARKRQGVQVDDVEAAVAERMDRQRVLHEGNHRFVFVVEEAVLRHRTCAPTTLSGQLRHLLHVMRLPTVSLGVIAQDASRACRWPTEGFIIFDAEQVRVELVSGYLTISQPREVAMYAQAFAELSAAASYGDRAQALITEALDALG
jgi:transcriptional regulator with XRE-family HTH domain